MFLKPFRIKNQSAVKNSDRKKLRNDFQSQYPSLSDQDVLSLIPQKEEMCVTRVAASGGEVVQIYFVQKNPVVFESYKNLYPTVYTLWKFPDLVQPVFRTVAPVLHKLQNGADLMLPGVIYDKEPSPKMFGNLQKGDRVSVAIAGNRTPIALGHALLSGEDMYMTALKGKGVSILHIIGDALWEAGDKSQPPPRPELHSLDPPQENGAVKGPDVIDNGTGAGLPDVSGLQVDETSPSEENVKDCEDEGSGKDEEEEDVEEDDEDPVAEMDKLLHFCFGCAIKSRIKDKDLPLLTVNLMRDFMQPFSPAKRLDVKKSSFKRLSKFLQQKVSESYITTKEQTKGVDVITTIDRNHPVLRDLDVPEAVEEESPTEAASSVEDEVCKALTFTDVYCVNAVTLDVFKEAHLGKGDALKMADVKEIVTKYVTDNDLLHKDNPRMSTLDPILAHTILKSSEGDLDHLPLDQVINRVAGKMQPAVAISSCDGLVKIKRGKLEPIKLDVRMRASNKKMTTVENLEEYGFDLKAFARTLQKAVACSCSVFQTPQKDKGPQVQVQGNQINFVSKMLIENCKIPPKYIAGLEKAPKQKKKK